MRKIIESVSVSRVLCVLICALMIYGLWCPILSYSNISNAAEKLSAEFSDSYVASVWECIALALDEEIDMELLEELSEYSWRQLKLVTKNTDLLEERIWDLDDYVWEVLVSYFDDDSIYDFYNDEINSTEVLRLFRNSTIKDALIVYAIITIAEEYTYDSGIESVVELDECLDLLQIIADDLSDRRISCIELCDFINAAYIAAQYIEAANTSSIFYAKQALENGTADQVDLRLLAIEKSVPFLFAAKILWPGLLIGFVISLICINYYAITGKKKRGLGLAVALLAIQSVVIIAVTFLCLKTNLAVTAYLEKGYVGSLPTVHIFHPALGGLLVLLLSVALIMCINHSITEPDGLLRFKKTTFFSEKTWKCICGNISSMEYQYCVRCGQKRPETDNSLRRCSRCGTELPLDYSFCISCGAKIDSPTDRNNPEAPPASAVRIRMGASSDQPDFDDRPNIVMRPSTDYNTPLSSAFKKPNSLITSFNENTSTVKMGQNDINENVPMESNDKIPVNNNLVGKHEAVSEICKGSALADAEETTEDISRQQDLPEVQFD